MRKISVAVLRNPDHNSASNASYYVSDRTTEAVSDAIRNGNARVLYIDSGPQLEDNLRRYADDIDILFNVSEGIPGSYVSSLLESLDIPYTGSDPISMDIGNDKYFTRRFVNSNVRQPFWLFANDEEKIRLLEDDYPLIVKPTRSAYSIGIDESNIVNNKEELLEVMRRIHRTLKQPVIIEEFLDGNEYTAGIIGNVVLPPIELSFENIPESVLLRSPDVKEKYRDCFFPADSETARDLAFQAVNNHISVHARDYTRSDFRTKKSRPNEPFFLEINMLPGIRPDNKSVIPKAASFAGIEYDDVIRSILAAALERYTKDYRYIQRLKGKDIDGFRDSYSRMLEHAAENGTEIVAGDMPFYVMKPEKDLLEPREPAHDIVQLDSDAGRIGVA